MIDLRSLCSGVFEAEPSLVPGLPVVHNEISTSCGLSNNFLSPLVGPLCLGHDHLVLLHGMTMPLVG